MIIGHQKQWELLKSSVVADKISHAYLFCGPEQVGKKKVAYEFAKLLNCQSKEGPCGKCRSCEDIEKNNHPDFLVVGNSVGEVRDAIWKLSLKPYSSRFKVAIIDNCDTMNKESQNCFLKTLEEPRGDSVLILISAYPDMLLLTIVSRTQKVRFFNVSDDKIRNYLVKKTESADKLTDLANGRPGKAMDFLANDDKVKMREKVIADLIKAKKSDLCLRFKYAKTLSDSFEDNEAIKLKEVLEIWLEYFRKVFFGKLEGNTTEGFENYTIGKIKKIISRIQEISYLSFATNINTKLALEVLLIEL